MHFIASHTHHGLDWCVVLLTIASDITSVSVEIFRGHHEISGMLIYSGKQLLQYVGEK